MHQASFKERAEFYKFTHAAKSMALCRDILRDIESRAASMEPWQKYVAWGSLATCYFRPFTQTPKHLYAIKDNVVPQHLYEYHEILRTMRNKVFAHTEADFQHAKITDPNSLVFRILQGGIPDFGFAWPEINNAHIPLFRDLIVGLGITMNNESVTIWNRWLPLMNDFITSTDHTAWRLNLEETSDDIFVPELQPL